MKLKLFTPKQSARDFIKLRPLTSDYEMFKHNLLHLLSRINEMEREENQKNCVRDFLRDTFYANYEINTKDTKDLVIHTGKNNNTDVAVIIEAKRPGNTAEMITPDKPNVKALHELVLYYMNERFGEKENISIKYCIATNINEWYIIDASFFENHFARNKAFVKLYKEWSEGKKVVKDTNLFYNQIAKPFIESINEEVPCTYFDIRELKSALQSAETDTNLLALYKVLSPFFLLREPFINDSNSLNERFYKELLHIIGLEEKTEGGKTVIRRKEHPNSGSIIENAISILETENPLHKVKDLSQYGDNKEDRIFNIALELSLTWINRILFLKLLEGQLVNYHKGDRDYRFLNIETLHDFNELYRLFHYVLLKPISERSKPTQDKYAMVPYLNSSLFEISQLEDETIKINQLNISETLELAGNSVLKSKSKTDHPVTLEYLFKFLDSFDFSSEGKEDTQDENRTLINASVLGKVFEKINGYKDGSVFTPGFITMYMCKQAIRPAVIQKFKDKYGWEINEFDDLKNYLADKRTKKDILLFNKLIDSLHICDPAVGSGHFLVSALNEIIAIKAELGIFADENGVRLTDYDIRIADDELVITDNHGDAFAYQVSNGKPLNEKMQVLQKTLFHEKQKLIENCLFGVDINPNSVQICRLRLWIELLKNAYYKEDAVLETLPNIDINIKCGNSLLSRFGLNDNLQEAFKKQQYNLESYKALIDAYRISRNSQEKVELLKVIRKIKEEYTSTIYARDPRRKKIAELRGQLELVKNNYNLFGQKMNEEEQKFEEKRIKISLEQHETELQNTENGTIYRQAFEWRFEFPEVLNEKGDYIGFDIVIGNPPYISIRDIEIKLKSIYKNKFVSAKDQFDLYILFIEKAFSILKSQGFFSFINPDKFLIAKYGKGILHFLSKNSEVINFKDVSKENVFGNISVYPIMLTLKKIINDSEIVFDKKYFEKFSDINTNTEQVALIDKIESVDQIEFDVWRPLATANEIIDGSEMVISNKEICKFQLNYLKRKTTTTHRDIDKTKIKILIKKLCYTIEAAIDTKGCIPVNTTYIITTKNTDVLKYVLSILNSKLLTYYVRTKFISTALRGGYIELRVYQIKELPIKLIADNEQSVLIKLVDNIIIAKKKGLATSVWENIIDALVFRLYNLTQAEMEQVLDSVKDLSTTDREQIINEYINITNIYY